MNYQKKLLFIALPVALFFCVFDVSGADWPMWRYDANRSAASPEQLPEELHLQWMRAYPPLKPAWPDEPRMRFDVGYEPIVMGQTMFVASSQTGSITALDTETGAEKWKYYAGAPVRFAPVVWNDNLYFTADDGCLYCLKMDDGQLLWKVQGAPYKRMVIGNERVISTWPARGGPVIEDGAVYFAAGIWPFMGVFIYSVDAETGEVNWVNDSSSNMYIDQPHDSPAFAGVAPQGYLVVSGDVLLVPNGRAVTAGFDKNTGEFLYFHHGENKYNGSCYTAANDSHFANSGRLFDSAVGRRLQVINEEREDVLSRTRNGNADYEDLIAVSHEPLLTDEVLYQTERNSIVAYDLTQDPRRRLTSLWEVSIEAEVKMIAGNCLYAISPGLVHVITLPETADETPAISHTIPVEGTPSSLLAADGKLFVVTLEGKILCYGGSETEANTYPYNPAELVSEADQWSAEADRIVNQTGITEGYCVALHVGSGRLIEELIQKTNLHILALDTDKAKIESFRQKYDMAGLLGSRIAFMQGDIDSVQLPPYMASLIVSEEMNLTQLSSTTYADNVFEALRPYGGTAFLPIAADQLDAFSGSVSEAELVNAEISSSGQWTLLKREGALPGSADWTHQYADSANTVVSKDQRVKAPLGVLWFGGSSNTEILPRHAHGPSEQIVGGQLFIEGPDIIRTLDVYTGRILWEASLPGIGDAYNYTSHEAGANSVGSNYVSVHDGIYVAYGNTCLRFDPATGELLSEFTYSDAGEELEWGYMVIWEDLLIAGLEPLMFDNRSAGQMDNYNATSSKHLVVMDRYSGDVLWTKDASNGFRHNTIIASNNKIFCIDRVPESMMRIMARRGQEYDETFTLYALNARDGSPVWSTTENVFGTWLSYSEEYDILLQAGRPSRDMVPEPNDRMITYQGADGTIVWDKDISYEGPCMLHGDTLITQHTALDLMTGEQKMRKHPLTGELIPWQFSRNYGCNTVIASEHLITFRSAAAGYYDLANDGGTGNLGGFKSGCTSNLIVANGVLNAPDYTRTCACSYQNATSLAMVHMPNNEMWTFNTLARSSEPINRIGLNFGAPGDRKINQGALWLDYPSKGSPSPAISIQTTPSRPEGFCNHTSRMGNSGLEWIAASGIKGINDITVTLTRTTAPSEPYTVRLFFAEPEFSSPGQRVFDVSIQGEKVLTNFDIIKETSAKNQLVFKEFKDIEVDEDLTIAFESGDASSGVPLINGIEILTGDAPVTDVGYWKLY